MRIFVQFILVVFLVMGCSNESDPVRVGSMQSNTGENENAQGNDNSDDDSEQNEVAEPVIDASDLENLPVDVGGQHLAFPLRSTSSPYGHYIYTPSAYNPDDHEYPLIIFLHGWSPNLGNQPLEDVLLAGPPKLIETGQWNPKFPFIVVSPQLTSNYWAPAQLHNFIQYLIKNYKINEKRIYLTGLSLGGGGCWYYVGELYDNYAAAIVPISASGSEHLIDNLRKVPIWAFHGALDTSVKAYENYGSVPMVEAINATSPLVNAKVTVYPNVGHNAWSRTYDGSGRNHYNQLHDKYNMDIYEWMLQYKKD